MRRLRSILAPETGQAMMLTICMMAVLAALGIGMVGVVVSETQGSGQAVRSDGSYQAAEAGIDNYLSKLLSDNEYYAQYVDPAEATRQSGANPSVGVSGSCTSASQPDPVAWTYPSSPAWTYPNGKDHWCSLDNNYEYDLQITPPSTTQNAIQIISTGQLVGSSSLSTERVIQVLVQPTSIANYEQIVNDDVAFNANTTGKVWSAGNITYQNGNTASANQYACSSSGNAFPTMIGGAKTYAGSTAVTNAGLSCPPPFASFLAPVSVLSSAAKNAGIYITDTSKQAYSLTFLSNGTISVKSCTTNGETSTSAPSCTAYLPQNCGTSGTSVCSGCSTGVCNVPSNGAIYIVQNAIVSGTVKGRVTVASNNDIVVSAPTGPVTAGTDVLGLIASNNLVFACYACTTNGPVFNFQAAAITQNGIFETSSAWPNDSGSNNMGSFSWTGSETDAHGGSMGGFVAPRAYSYDSTLQYLPPPWFPTVGTPYSITLFREIPPS